MRGVLIMASVAFAIVCSGCGSLLTADQKHYKDLVYAKEIDQITIDTAVAVTDQTLVKGAIGKVLIKSEQNCDNFTKALSISNINSNAFLDVWTTIFSAVATATTRDPPRSRAKT